jgi:hypothetical protein
MVPLVPKGAPVVSHPPRTTSVLHGPPGLVLQHPQLVVGLSFIGLAVLGDIDHREILVIVHP